MERRIFAALAAVVALVSATGALAATAGDVRVAPKHGSRHSTFTVRFTAREASGQHGAWIRSYVVEAVGPKGHGCSDSSSRSPKVNAGGRVRVRLAPRSRWCSGAFDGHVYTIKATNCRKRRPCPMNIRIRDLGHFSFEVRK